ncbi:hypothetical protein [Streptomyces sp. NBC_01465]|uniref:hypothetical protein n=1 Tax=Streptomyces sp. NBC_01465 TaxID=2903878 RepID=UPI002E37A728|nr:hypothetical protein [Streptomyces sp. NBC_01465]
MAHRVSATDAELDRFWKEFAALNWERQPLSRQTSPVRLGLADWELLRALRLTADLDDGSGLPRIVVTVDGRAESDDPRPFLPLPDDSGLDAYLARVDTRMRNHEWSVAVSGLDAVDVALRDRAGRLADDVRRHTGSRAVGRVDVGAFIGRYASSHADAPANHAHAGIFGFTLRGKQLLLTWPPERGNQVPLVGVPGALTYIPAGQLHVGRSPDAVAVNVNFAFCPGSEQAAA